jgi:hypothetical protein
MVMANKASWDSFAKLLNLLFEMKNMFVVASHPWPAKKGTSRLNVAEEVAAVEIRRLEVGYSLDKQVRKLPALQGQCLEASGQTVAAHVVQTGGQRPAHLSSWVAARNSQWSGLLRTRRKLSE